MPRFHVERSIEIAVTPENAFDAVSDFSTWTTWSPWLIAEPDANVQVSADPSSIGSTYAWDGMITGQGEVEHIELLRGKSIVDEIRFLKPMKSISEVRFDFEPISNGTRVTWHMDGSLPWFMFWMTSMMNGWIGMDYARGLRMLEEWLETQAILSKVNVKGVVPIGPIQMAGIRKKCAVEEISSSREEA